MHTNQLRTFVADAHEGGRAHVTVANHAFAVALSVWVVGGCGCLGAGERWMRVDGGFAFDGGGGRAACTQE